MAVPAEATRDLPNSIEPAFDGPVAGPADLEQLAPLNRSLPFFSIADLEALSAGRTYDYDDPSSRFCIYDGPGRLSSSTEGEGFAHPHFFQGLWTDPVTGISYARNRWYDARTASWLSPDPMGAIDSPNLYAAFAWAPHMNTDPMGDCIPGCTFFWTTGPGRKIAEGFGEAAVDTSVGLGKAASHPLGFAHGMSDQMAQGLGTRIDQAESMGGTAYEGFGLFLADMTMMTPMAEAITGFEAYGDQLSGDDRLKRVGHVSFGVTTTAVGYGIGRGLAGAGAVTRTAAGAGRFRLFSGAGRVTRSSMNRGIGSRGPIGWSADKFRGFRLRGIHRTVAAEVDAAIQAGDRAALRGLGASRRQTYRVLRPRSHARFRGTIIDQAVKARAAQSFGLKGLRAPRAFEYGPDFWNPKTMRAWDMTTPGQWSLHIEKYVTNPAAGRPMWRALYPVLH